MIFIFFDRPLTPGPSDHTNWLLRADTRQWEPIFPVASVGSVTFKSVIGGFQFGDRVSYLATPPDLFGATGTPVAQFIGFPVTVI